MVPNQDVLTMLSFYSWMKLASQLLGGSREPSKPIEPRH